MEQSKIIQALQDELQAMSERHAADARSAAHIKNLIGRLNLSVINDDEQEFVEEMNNA